MVNPTLPTVAMKTDPTPSTSSAVAGNSASQQVSPGSSSVMSTPLQQQQQQKVPTLNEMAAQMKEISERMAQFIRDRYLSPSLQACSTKDEISVCEDVEVLRKKCLNLHREKEMMRIQLDILNLQRQLDQESHLRRSDEIKDDAVEGCKAEFCTKIVETLQSEFSCSICNEVFMQPTVTNCGHTFCNYCIMEWTHDKRNCPICRKWIPDAGSLQKHVEMDNFVTKIYGFLGGEWVEGRNTLERDRAETARNAVRRRETEAREAPSVSSRSRYPPSGFLQFPFERRRRIERYLDDERLLNNNNNNINNNNELGGGTPSSPVSNFGARDESPSQNDPWYVARRISATLNPGNNSNTAHSSGAISAPSTSSPNPTTPQPSGSNATSSVRTPPLSEEMTVQRELYRRLVYMESDRFQNMPRTYQQHILRTLYGDRGDSSILTDPSVMNAMLASRPRGEQRGEGPGSSGGSGATLSSAQAFNPLAMHRASLPSCYGQPPESGNNPPRYLSMLRRIHDNSARASRYRYRSRPSAAERDGAASSGSGGERPHRRAAVELIQHVLGRSSQRTGGDGNSGNSGEASSDRRNRERCIAFRANQGHGHLLRMVENREGSSRGGNSSNVDRSSTGGGTGNSGLGNSDTQDSEAVVFPMNVGGSNNEVRVSGDDNGNSNNNHETESDEVVLLEWPGSDGSSQNGNNNDVSNEREQRENLPLPYSPVSPLARDVEAQEPENELGDDMDISNIWN